MQNPILPFLFRPYIRRELPGWGRLFKWLNLGGINNVNPYWRNAGTYSARGKRHGYLMSLDLRDDLDRSTYFLGRYYDLNIQLLLEELLKPGDTFLDVGANVGHTTLHGAALVGPTGKVIAVEPQSECCKRIRETLLLNNIKHVEIHNVGLADKPDTLTLKVLEAGTIMAAFAIDPERDGPNVREEITVQVLTGDSVVNDSVVGRLVIKIDVEGYELHVLRGLKKTIAKYHPPILTEIEPRYLRRAGVSEQELSEFMYSCDYRMYAIGLKQRRLGIWNLELIPLKRVEDLQGEIDVLWLHSST